MFDAREFEGEGKYIREYVEESLTAVEIYCGAGA
jgi:hypothetical protein